MSPDASEAHVAVLSGHQADVETDAGGCVHVSPDGEDTLLFDLVLEDIECVTQAHVYEGDRSDEGDRVASLFEFTGEPDGTGDGDPLTTDPDTPLIHGETVDDADLVEDILDDPGDYYVNVHTVHNPEGEIRGQIRGFDRGGETDIEPEPAEFTVSGLEPPNATVIRGDSIDVSARVRNEGDVTDTQTVELRIGDSVVAERELELACRTSTTVRFEDVDTEDLDPQEYEHGVFTDDDSMRGTLRVLTPPEFVVSDLDPQDATVTQGDRLDVSATVENVGEATGTQTVELRIDDDSVEEEEVNLEGDESETVSFEDVATGGLDPGEYEHGVFTEDDSETGTLTIQTPAEFAVSDLDPQDATVTRGDQIDVSATVENVGQATATQTVEFRVDDELMADEDVELAGDESVTVGFEGIDTGGLEPGTHEHGVFSWADSETAILTVEEPEAEDGDPENGDGDDGTDGNVTDDDGIGDNGTDDDGIGDNGTDGNGTDDDGIGGNGTDDDGIGDNGTDDDGIGDNGTDDDGIGGNGTDDDGIGGNGTDDNGTADNGIGGNGTDDDGIGGNGTDDNGIGDNGTVDDGA